MGANFSLHMKRFNISEPIPWIYFIFGAKLQFFIGNILEHIGRMYFLFDMNVALHKFFFKQNFLKLKTKFFSFFLNLFLGNFFDQNFILNYKKKKKKNFKNFFFFLNLCLGNFFEENFILNY